MNPKKTSDAHINLTPMIDVVFQLIIFFIVTVKITKTVDPDIFLGHAPHGEQQVALEQPLVVEVNKRGRLSIQGAQLTEPLLKTIIRQRKDRYGLFPLMIRADRRVRHQHVKNVLDICNQSGLRELSIVAVKEHR